MALITADLDDGLMRLGGDRETYQILNIQHNSQHTRGCPNKTLTNLWGIPTELTTCRVTQQNSDKIQCVPTNSQLTTNKRVTQWISNKKQNIIFGTPRISTCPTVHPPKSRDALLHYCKLRLQRVGVCGSTNNQVKSLVPGIIYIFLLLRTTKTSNICDATAAQSIVCVDNANVTEVRHRCVYYFCKLSAGRGNIIIWFTSPHIMHDPRPPPLCNCLRGTNTGNNLGKLYHCAGSCWCQHQPHAATS